MTERHDERMTRFWLIEPTATFADSRWQDRPIWRAVVAAPTANLARQVAAAWALPGPQEVQIGNESDSPLAGFNDEKLYRVREVPADPAWRNRMDGTGRQVIDAELLREAPDIIEI